MKQRVVVIGAGGFVGSHIAQALDAGTYEVIGLSRKECDLAQPAASAVIEKTVKDGDIVVCAAAKAPAKNLEMLAENVTMISHLAEALRHKKLAYLLNISSDAVYGDSMGKLDENSPMAPLSAHGIMHCMREFILEKTVTAPIGHIRPTLIFGASDPHNGYGPNSFVRIAKAGKKIELFGNGEEQRDHIFVGDVAKLAVAMIEQKIARGVNAVSGKTISFMDIAQLVRDKDKNVEISSKPRSGPMPHNGYRAFSNDAARKICPGFPFKTIDAYIGDALEMA